MNPLNIYIGLINLATAIGINYLIISQQAIPSSIWIGQILATLNYIAAGFNLAIGLKKKEVKK